jgi:hypothetical protein
MCRESPSKEALLHAEVPNGEYVWSAQGEDEEHIDGPLGDQRIWMEVLLVFSSR